MINNFKIKGLEKLVNSSLIRDVYPMIDHIDIRYNGDLYNPRGWGGLEIDIFINDPTITEKNMMHGSDYLGEDVTGWLMSEKLNGCRGFLDGEQMWSRGGSIIYIPDVMRLGLPVGIALDGEIHAGRNGFEIARRGVQYNQWDTSINYSVFDAPFHSGCFSERYDFISAQGKWH